MPSRGGGAASPARSGGPTRDLRAARESFLSGNAEASRRAHGAGGGDVSYSDAAMKQEAGHMELNVSMKSAIECGVEGIVGAATVIAGAEGLGLNSNTVFFLAAASVVASSLCMGLSDYFFKKSENEFILQEKRREEWELENYPEGEVREMVELCMAKGVSKEDAQDIMAKCAKYPKFFVDLMVKVELQLQEPGDHDDPITVLCIRSCSRALFGTVPVLPYAPPFLPIIAGSFDSSHPIFIVSCIISAAMIFILGVLKTKLSRQQWWVCVAELFAVGSFAVLVAFAVGYSSSSFTSSHHHHYYQRAGEL